MQQPGSIAGTAATLSLALTAMLLFGGCKVAVIPPASRPSAPPMTEYEKSLSADLKRDLQKLAGDIGERNYVHYEALNQAADWIESELKRAGYGVVRQAYEARGKRFYNLEATLGGVGEVREIVVVGAHYDSVAVNGCRGANDNGSGVVSALALARALAGSPQHRTIKFVFFTNEEPPFFQTEEMGSLVYARACKARGDRIVSMLCLETMGFYSDRPGSQNYPAAIAEHYPKTGNFIAFVGNPASEAMLNRIEGHFRAHASIASVGAVGPEALEGIGWSDHWSFWQQGYPAVMATDTAPFRYPHYHTAQDSVDQVDFDNLARVTAGLEAVVKQLASSR